jgi:hypothetical protein
MVFLVMFISSALSMQLLEHEPQTHDYGFFNAASFPLSLSPPPSRPKGAKSESVTRDIPQESVAEGNIDADNDHAREDLTTMAVVVGLGSLSAIVLAVLCFSKRTFIGKTATSARDEALTHNMFDRVYAGSESLESIRPYTQPKMKHMEV